MRSMTGFGSAENSQNGAKISIQISSYNRKQADIRFNLPRELTPREPELRKRIHDRISRGAITVKIDVKFDPKVGESLTIDRDLASTIFRELTQIKSLLELDGNISLQDLLSLQNVEIIKRSEFDFEKISEAIHSILGQALQELVDRKDEEGESIKLDLEGRHKKLTTYVNKVMEIAPEIPKRHQKILTQRIQQNLEEIPIDEDRILKEVVLFADRCDISEEITRLSTHLTYMDKLFKKSEPVGRKLDFLIQEIFREINTIGSKCNDIDISTTVIDFKSELERVREQVQNIE